MNIIQITALLLILGTVLTYTGFGAFPPRIYTEKNIQKKLNLLAAHPRLWILTQTLVILGGIASRAGSIFPLSFLGGSQGALLAGIGVGGVGVGRGPWGWC